MQTRLNKMPYTVKLRKPCINMDLSCIQCVWREDLHGRYECFPLSTFHCCPLCLSITFKALCPCVKLSHRIKKKKPSAVIVHH